MTEVLTLVAGLWIGGLCGIATASVCAFRRTTALEAQLSECNATALKRARPRPDSSRTRPVLTRRSVCSRTSERVT
ncbi:MAG: hypothetical protein QOH13_42 [Thermoleophilaceae bacterium]|nr:hypothetical protein [Thermoleophilaceae bacterium]